MFRMVKQSCEELHVLLKKPILRSRTERASLCRRCENRPDSTAKPARIPCRRQRAHVCGKQWPSGRKTICVLRHPVGRVALFKANAGGSIPSGTVWRTGIRIAVYYPRKKCGLWHVADLACSATHAGRYARPRTNANAFNRRDCGQIWQTRKPCLHCGHGPPAR